MLKIFLILLSINLCWTLYAANPIHNLLNLRNLHLQPPIGTSHIDEINTIKTQCVTLNKNMMQKDGQKYKFLIDKTSQLSNDFTNLELTLLKYHLQINHSSKLCPGVTTFNRTQIRQEIISIQINQQDTTSYLSTCIDCSSFTNSISNIQNLSKVFITNINQTLDGKYCNTDRVSNEKASGIVNLNSSYFKNNLNAKNWYYGSTTASDYKIYIFQRSAKYNLTSCPLDKPFVKDQNQVCFACPQESIYNIGKQKCDTCEPNQILNIHSGQCDECKGQKKLIDGVIVCKLCIISNGELFNATNGHCYKCSGNTYLDTDKLACTTINCPVNTPRFNRTTKQCSACPQSQIIDPKDSANCIKTNFIALCHPSTPKYDTATKTCNACQPNTIYNSITNQCDKKQPAHQTFVNKINHYDETTPCTNQKPFLNKDTNQCQSCKQGEQYNTVQKRCKIKIICGSTQVLETATSTCVDTASTCRDNQVYVLKVNRCLPKSVTCDQDQFYNPDEKKCIEIAFTCKQNEYYNIKQKTCNDKKSRCRSNQQYNQTLSTCVKLILCKDNQYYNKDLHICENGRMKCNPQKQIYNEKNNVCVEVRYVTSPYSQNLIIPSSINYGKLVKTYSDQKNIVNVKDCPSQTPYFAYSKCISCPSGTPYFNLAQNSCVKCDKPQGSTYIKSCQAMEDNLSGVSSTFDKINI